ncbi:hypothetical protein [Streptomyces camelliae]|uniref:Beta-lactamase-related domain-containing protein n=1 Tax=Streptomyces camelliae TaxID=3004093 RepID=A0ABY7NUW8_9ACTN|nr:hypothetical protein [Streptomyces sp. HUAS 2-6]WBO62046.1 hypothetical protein O1G22_03950 [Streptomyces sp. HUAS 2-6]
MAGPLAEAAVAAEVVRTGGLHRDRRLLREETCAAFVRDQRPADVMDETMEVPRALGAGGWGLGLMLDTFDFGRPCSPRAVGRTGGSACPVLTDPDTGLTIAAHFDGNASLTDRVRRDHALCTAVCTDLGLTRPDAQDATTWPRPRTHLSEPHRRGRRTGVPRRWRTM